MEIVAQAGQEDIAVVYIGKFDDGKMVECVEAVQPPLPRERKWVLQVSTLYGCPAGCMMCDAGGFYQGKISREDILAQIDFLVYRRFPSGKIPCGQFKIQFARMGEPSLNPAVLEVLDELPLRYDAPGLIPSISTIAPTGADTFFRRLREIKANRYSGGRFQLQFSIHTTDAACRDRLMPIRKWNLGEIASYGESFYETGDRKTGLNFALAVDSPLDPRLLLKYFDPGKFLIKLTPLNPSYRAQEHGLVSHFRAQSDEHQSEIIHRLRAAGYEVILSIGEAEENRIGSNCGQYLRTHQQATINLPGAYTYPIHADFRAAKR